MSSNNPRMQEICVQKICQNSSIALFRIRLHLLGLLYPPQILQEDLPLTLLAAHTVLQGRLEVENVLKGDDDRLLVVVGPCSVHNPEAALDYAKLFEGVRGHREKMSFSSLCVFTLKNPAPPLDGRALLMTPTSMEPFKSTRVCASHAHCCLKLRNSGCLLAASSLIPLHPSIRPIWCRGGAIGARTTESQVHRELTSALSMPTGFKNSTDGSVGIAIDACRAARTGHVFLSVGKEGLSSIIETEGNPYVHIIMRGGSSGPNYAAEYVRDAGKKLKSAGIDCSHGNSSKQHEKQKEVAEDIAQQLESQDTSSLIMGVMLESNLVEGRQDIPSTGLASMRYGQSVTDACISWETTIPVLERLRAGVKGRRALAKQAALG
ncbi:Glycosyltransferase family 1 protein [Mycena sanguinolenta]|uniref:Phospho-2-dehydro-3-deoxyheptonate aldolase n=1 Tax=Mycena sanguinolenta TaxID=230812 RepID=A0A8H7CS55_9AGAR|nr:Glycosyltransferase family 1 protein [Mycena sanguinolenta]